MELLPSWSPPRFLSPWTLVFLALAMPPRFLKWYSNPTAMTANTMKTLYRRKRIIVGMHVQGAQGREDQGLDQSCAESTNIDSRCHIGFVFRPVAEKRDDEI